MKTYHILYNPLAGTKEDRDSIMQLEASYVHTLRHDLTKTDVGALMRSLPEQDAVILCGGDGTLNRFANAVKKTELKNSIYYYACGTGNDFARDLEIEKCSEPNRLINRCLTALPTVEVNGEKRLFVNGVGFGIDGYCCEVGDKLRRKKEKVNYTTIAVKGLLFHYRRVNASVTVDGQVRQYKKVWLAPTMNGRYYGGGMMPAPQQRRLQDDNPLSLVVLHGSGKLKTLCVFPSLFQGKHVRHTEMVEILTGHDIAVEFDRPTPLQIDGETVRNVTRYRACSHGHADAL